MSDKNVYEWHAKWMKVGFKDAFIDDPMPIEIGLFWHCKPIKEAYVEWRGVSGVRNVLEEGGDREEFADECKRTVKWVENGCLDPIGYHVYYVENLSQDILNVPYSVPCVSQKVVDILKEACPEDVEAFRVSINFETEKKYYIINLTKGLREEAFLKNGLGEINMCRLIRDGEYGEDITKILVSEKVIKQLQEGNIQVMDYLKYKENSYAS